MIKKLSECPADGAVEAAFVAKATNSGAPNTGKTLLVTRLSQWLGMMRAMQLWFHGAHHVTRGTAFAGDHVNLFGRIYTALEEEIDGAIEKAVGVTGDEGLACPTHVTQTALQAMEKYPSPPSLTSLAMASVALEMERNYIEMLEQMFTELEGSGHLSLGLNDMLAASANTHETHVYLLQQRVKAELEG